VVLRVERVVSLMSDRLIPHILVATNYRLMLLPYRRSNQVCIYVRIETICVCVCAYVCESTLSYPHVIIVIVMCPRHAVCSPVLIQLPASAEAAVDSNSGDDDAALCTYGNCRTPRSASEGFGVFCSEHGAFVRVNILCL